MSMRTLRWMTTVDERRSMRFMGGRRRWPMAVLGVAPLAEVQRAPGRHLQGRIRHFFAAISR